MWRKTATIVERPKGTRTGRWLRWMLAAPFRLGWWFSTRVERSIGILFTLLLGALLLTGGIFLCSTFIGIIIGVPLAAAGAFLVLRALY